MTENYMETIPIFGILTIACSFKIWKSVFFSNFDQQKIQGLENKLSQFYLSALFASQRRLFWKRDKGKSVIILESL